MVRCSSNAAGLGVSQMDGRLSLQVRSLQSPSHSDDDAHVSKYQKPNDESRFDGASTEKGKSNDAISEKTDDESENSRSESYAAKDSSVESTRARSSRKQFSVQDHITATDDDQKMEEPESKDSPAGGKQPKLTEKRDVGRNDFVFRNDVKSRTVMFENVKRQGAMKVKRLFYCIPKFGDFTIQRIRWERNGGLRIVLSTREEAAGVVKYWKEHPFGFDGRSQAQGFRVH